MNILELIDGRIQEPALTLPGRLDDPDTGADLGPQRASDPTALQQALAAATRASTDGEWTGLAASDRAAVLERFAQELDRRAETIATLEATDSGVPIAITRAIAGSLGGIVRDAVAQAEEAGERRSLEAGGRRVEVLRLPWGPAALLTPWNAPAPTAVTKLANALAAGCPAILKPSEHAPASAAEIALAAVAAGLPAGAVQVVHGGAEVALSLASDPRIRVVSLTGSTSAGQAIASVAGARMAELQLELGGSNAAIVTADADVAAAASALVAGVTKLNGQWCEAPRRVLAIGAVHDSLLDALAAELEGVRLGPALSPETTTGPLAHRSHLEHVRAQVAGLGADTISPVEEPADGGLYFGPRVVFGLPPEAVRREIFGPVLTLHRVVDEEQAIGAANATGDGLAGYVFAGDPVHAFELGRRIAAGEIRLGGTNLLDLAPGSSQSFWGSSGIGGHGRRAVFERYRGTRIVGEDDPALPI